MAADTLEALYGGAAGGGKSDALLMGALQFVDVPRYSAALFRRTYSDLALPGALMSRAAEWLQGTAARWNSDTKTWTFPSGATLTFAYLDSGNDRYRYQSSEFQYIGFDETTQFQEQDYTYLFSRIRRLAGSQIPLRMRAASNPGNVGHAWVKRRFLSPEAKKAGRLFVAARLTDNPHIDREEYKRALDNLDPFTRKQLLEGDWSEFEGNHYHPHDWPRFRIRDGAFVLGRRIVPPTDIWLFAVVDPATSASRRADHTAIMIVGVAPTGDLLILHVFRRQIDVGEVLPTLAALCRDWRPAFVGIEEVGFQKLLTRGAAQHRDIPPVKALKPQGKGKLVRSVPAIVAAEGRKIHLPEDESPWLDDLITELAAFTGSGDDDADDQADCLAYAVIASQEFRPTQVGEPCILTPAPERLQLPHHALPDPAFIDEDYYVARKRRWDDHPLFTTKPPWQAG